MSKIIRKSHNVGMIMYHIVCPAKYRRTVITGEGDEKLKEVCKGYRSKV
jgi:REP element-mobilizing transposase RayT